MATKGKKLWILNEAYAELPSVECKGLCWNACAAIPVYPVELKNLETVAGRELTSFLGVEFPDGARVLARPDLACPLLVMKRCSVYGARPLVCRAFGAVQGLPCPHGCRSAEPMSDQRFDSIRLRVAKL